MKKQNRLRFANIGFPSILLAFSMISIVTFSALALVTANSDYRLSRKVADRSSAYYQAQENAIEKISLIDQELQDIYLSTYTEKEFCQNTRILLSDFKPLNQELEISKTGSFVINCSFTEPINEQQALAITMTITYPQTDTMSFYDITKWQTISYDLQFEEEEEPLHLLGVDEIQ